jgi:predicted TPR repeat methyltransferase
MADQLDDRFLNRIDYRVPTVMADLLKSVVRKNWKGDLLDAGCGTGILGPLLAPFAKSLTGVDLAARMLDRARDRNIYDELTHTDLVEYLTAHPHAFDAIFAAEVLIYKGTLAHVMRAVHAALKTGGLFVFDVESMEGGTYLLNPTGRFMHSKTYISDVIGDYFTIEASTELNLRREAGHAIKGIIFVLKRK